MIVNRIETFLAETKMSPSIFADAIGVQRATISHILSGRNNPSLDFVQKVLSRFPNLNPDWILSGKGEIWRDADNSEGSEEMPKVLTRNTQSQQRALFDIPVANKTSDQEEEKNIRVDDTKVSAGRRVLQNMVKPGSLKTETPVNEIHRKKIQKVIVLYTDQTFEAFTEF